jgi:glutathione S-transferase
MSSKSPDLIFHAYPQSPVAEKVRLVFGIKGLDWLSVEIPRIPPKPFLLQLTGGYRRTPVMQIGADIYCDSQCIIRELERRFPTPTLFPDNNEGLLWALSRWTDGELFDLGVKIVLGSAGEKLPKDFAEDRGRLYLGPDWAEGLKKANAELPHLVAQMRASLSWLNNQLSDGRKFLCGDAPAAIDAQFYHIVWFLRGRWTQGAALLSEFSNVETWEKSVASIGHGQSSEMSPQQAIEVAANHEPEANDLIDRNDPQGLPIGAEVVVTPDVNGGEQPVQGSVRTSNVDEIILTRHDEEAGELAVHFPRAGYKVSLV